jgi:asparagine synthase (glutamine-hydrolysing)
MCGISGIIMKDSTSVDAGRLKVMNDVVIHRGPDGEGFYFNRNVGFGHRRLSIIDLSELGSQPMKYGEDLTITYNGEIYNYIEIREDLKKKGYSFNSGSDTEVILAAYNEWGEGCVHQFNGMWAFAIHDIKRNIVFISRDRFGVKPLHYFEDQKSFLFGSEIKQILTQVEDRKVNKQILFDYLYLGYHHHTNDTFFEGIFSLGPGHNMIFNLATSSYKISKWYELKVNEEFEKLTFEAAQKLFESSIDNAIHLRLRSDVQVGTCLSGGLDSSYIAVVASKAYNNLAQEKFNAITAKSIEKENDESIFAEMVVNRADLNWKIAYPQKEDFFKVVEDVIVTQEEPFGGPSIIMQYFVMEKSKKEGCIVLLDGQGGDEALLGYDRYYAAYLNQQKGIFNKIKSYLNITRNSKLNIKDLFLYTLYFNKAKVRAIRQLRRNNYIKEDFKTYLNIDLLKEISNAGKNISNLQKLEITKVQLQKLLKYEDRNSMRFSIETRVPFVDYKVMELSFSLPFDYKVNGGWSKYILRKSAERKLPKEIVWRQAKIGFEAPKNWYINKSFLLQTVETSEFLNQFINSNKISKNIDDTSLWKLYNLAVWSKKFNVQW